MAPARLVLAFALAAALLHGAAAGAPASPRRLLTEPRVAKSEGPMPISGGADDVYLPPAPVPSAPTALGGAQGSSQPYSSGTKGKYGGYGHGYGYGYGGYGYGHEKLAKASKAVDAGMKALAEKPAKAAPAAAAPATFDLPAALQRRAEDIAKREAAGAAVARAGGAGAPKARAGASERQGPRQQGQGQQAQRQGQGSERWSLLGWMRGMASWLASGFRSLYSSVFRA